MLRRLALALLLAAPLSIAAPLAGCSDDDFGQERPVSDASAAVPDGGEDLAGEDLTGQDLTGEDLTGQDLTAQDLTGQDK